MLPKLYYLLKNRTQDNSISNEKNNQDFKNLFSAFFQKKERSYTKLKYSRVPQFDTVSGSIASILAILLGSLITEKYGWELPDSGDFFVASMYIASITLTISVHIKLIKTSSSKFTAFSFSNIVEFYFTIFSLLINFLKYLVKYLVKFFNK